MALLPHQHLLDAVLEPEYRPALRGEAAEVRRRRREAERFARAEQVGVRAELAVDFAGVARRRGGDGEAGGEDRGGDVRRLLARAEEERDERVDDGLAEALRAVSRRAK